MSDHSWVAIYSALILLAAMLGGYVPFLSRVTHSRLQLYLSASAGVMLGASFFHVMPQALDALDNSETKFGWWMSLGVVGLFCIERFIAPHSHELDGAKHSHGENDLHHHHDHAEVDHRAAAPAVAGWMAVLGLTIHTFMNGVGLAGSVKEEMTAAHQSFLTWPPPGLAMFLAIVLHKPADALAISTVLTRKGISRNLVAIVLFGFALMVAAGAAVFFLTSGAIAEDMQSELTGAALAFSAGTFLFIALSDLLPEVQFHRHDRMVLFLALLFGVGLMGGISYLEHAGSHDTHGHQHHGHSHNHKH